MRFNKTAEKKWQGIHSTTVVLAATIVTVLTSVAVVRIMEILITSVIVLEMLHTLF